MQKICFYAGLLGVLAVVPAMSQESPPNADKVASAQQKDSEIRDSLGRLLGPITTEIVNENRAAEKELHLLARVEVQYNEIIEFYEPAPGQILISRAGAPDARSPLDPIPRDPLETWWRAAPGFEMPAALREAIGRWREHEPTPEKAAPEPGKEWGGGEPAPHQSGGWCDTGYFNSGIGDCPSSFYDFKVCLNNWWNGAYARHYDAWISYTQVCAASGPVLLKVTSDEFGGGAWTVSTNTYRWWSGRDNPCIYGWDDCPYVRADVKDASGDRFHFQFGAVSE
jgi:hypothetical protein